MSYKTFIISDTELDDLKELLDTDDDQVRGDVKHWIKSRKKDNRVWENRNKGGLLRIEVRKSASRLHAQPLDVGWSLYFRDIEVLTYQGTDIETSLPRLSLTPVDEKDNSFSLCFGGGCWMYVKYTYISEPGHKPTIVFGEGTPEHADWIKRKEESITNRVREEMGV